jgi:hypothetical protein
MSDQPDDLRTRIAAALYRQAVPSPLLPWEEAFPVVRNVWLGMADAVISEIPELTYGYGHLHCGTHDDDDRCPCPCCGNRPTEWKPDNEPS